MLHCAVLLHAHSFSRDASFSRLHIQAAQKTVADLANPGQVVSVVHKPSGLLARAVVVSRDVAQGKYVVRFENPRMGERFCGSRDITVSLNEKTRPVRREFQDLEELRARLSSRINAQYYNRAHEQRRSMKGALVHSISWLLKRKQVLVEMLKRMNDLAADKRDWWVNHEMGYQVADPYVAVRF
jgi:hypothetical protein